MSDVVYSNILAKDCSDCSPTFYSCSCESCTNCPTGYCRNSITSEVQFCDGNPFKINCQETFNSELNLWQATYCDNV